MWSLIPGAALIAGCGSQPKDKTSEHSPQKPNVVYLIADDLGIGDLSCYGATKVSTPNIDRLAGQGMQFTNAYATSSTSTPSRFGLLTGMYPWRQENTGIAPGNSELIIDTACVTMADMFKEEGYCTGAVGKWHLGLGPKGGTDFNHEIKPNTQDIGFDYEFIIPATVDRVPCVFVENAHVVGLDPKDPITVNYNHKVGDWPTGLENPESVKMKPSQGHNNTIINGIPRIGWMTGGKSALWTDEDIADVITDKAKNFITAHKDEPFFLYMGTQDVHVPRVPHPRFAGKSGLGVRGDVILQLDWTVGEIMHTLDSLGIADNTIFVFCSDNGSRHRRRLSGPGTRTAERPYSHEALPRWEVQRFRCRYPLFPSLYAGPMASNPGKQQAPFSMIDVYASIRRPAEPSAGSRHRSRQPRPAQQLSGNRHCRM